MAYPTVTTEYIQPIHRPSEAAKINIICNEITAARDGQQDSPQNQLTEMDGRKQHIFLFNQIVGAERVSERKRDFHISVSPDVRDSSAHRLSSLFLFCFAFFSIIFPHRRAIDFRQFLFD